MELRRLNSAWDVDRRIVLDSADKLVVVRFSSFENPPQDVLEADLKATALSSSPLDARENPSQDVKRRRVDGGGSGTLSMPVSSPRKAASSHYLATMQMDAMLAEVAPKVRKYAVIYAVDTTAVTAFNSLYELGHDRDPFAVMCFYRNTHIRIDVGTGNNNKINFFAFDDKDELIDIITAAYRAGKLGKNVASSDKKYSTVSVQR